LCMSAHNCHCNAGARRKRVPPIYAATNRSRRSRRTGGARRSSHAFPLAYTLVRSHARTLARSHARTLARSHARPLARSHARSRQCLLRTIANTDAGAQPFSTHKRQCKTVMLIPMLRQSRTQCRATYSHTMVALRARPLCTFILCVNLGLSLPLSENKPCSLTTCKRYIRVSA
jgi:hypothetical protein